MNNNSSRLHHSLRSSSILFTGFALIFLAFLMLSSIVEVSLGLANHAAENNFLTLTGNSLLRDLDIFLGFLLPAYVIYMLLSLISIRLAQVIFKVGVTAFIAIELILIFYFNTALQMLGSDLFGYSIEEIRQIIGASDSLNFSYFLILLSSLLLLGFALNYFLERIRLPWKISLVFPVLSAIFILLGSDKLFSQTGLNSEFERNLVVNKSAHFISEAWAYFNPEISKNEVDIYSETYFQESLLAESSFPEFDYPDRADYPFLHESMDSDVLSPFLSLDEQKPNIAIIIVEGLGRAFANEGAYLGNFTPFLDSLSQKSLYWPNFLSNGGRTFAVLPSSLGSLPFGKKGVMEMEKIPEHFSLVNLLKSENYETSFYYGGNSEFDGMAKYLQNAGIGAIHDEDDFPGNYEKIPATAAGFSWGYGDKELYDYYLNSVIDYSETKPRLDVLLTISTHDPFYTDEPDKYARRFENRMDELGFSEEKKADYRKYQEQYATILYADDAIQDLIQSYRKLSEFENTIFLITGDHRLPEIPMATKIDRFHVPFIIYSPMLNRPAKFEAVSSHFDIAPSLLALLGKKYDMKLPEMTQFSGAGLDTSVTFRNINKIPLKQTKTELRDFVMGEYHLNGSDLYQIGPGMSELRIEDEARKQELISAFNTFKTRNNELVSERKILPDSLVRKYLD